MRFVRLLTRYVSFRLVTFHFVSLVYPRYVSLRLISFRHVMFRFVTLRFVSLRYVTLRYASLRYVTLRFVSLLHVSFRFVYFTYLIISRIFFLATGRAQRAHQLRQGAPSERIFAARRHRGGHGGEKGAARHASKAVASAREAWHSTSLGFCPRAAWPGLGLPGLSSLFCLSMVVLFVCLGRYSIYVSF